jgi:hypothetical protein
MKRLLPLVFVSLLLAGRALGFCNLPQPRLVCAEYFASEVVVEATLVKVKTIRDREDPEAILAYVYTLHTDRIFRGRIATVFREYEGNDSGRATFEWKIGRRYLLFLSYWGLQKSWTLDGCGNSGPLSKAKGALEEIAVLQRRRGDGVIHGAVSEHDQPGPVSGILVEARGGGKVYTATTNARGEFEIKVPPGRYVVWAEKAGYSFGAADVSYEDPNGLQVEPGGCVQVQLDAE